VPAGEVLSAAGPLAEARYVTFSAGEFSMALTLEEARTGNALLALRLNSHPLPPGRGGPCRLVGAGQDCWFNIKWLEHMEVTADRPAETAREIALTAVGQLKPPGNVRYAASE
jgi:DMSO/TMAO reductase YedYZ molybdopterin-dependent catalytic subunit